MGLHQTKNSFCIAKELINKMKRQPMEWEKIFANHISDQGLMSKIYKELIQLNNKKQKEGRKGGREGGKRKKAEEREKEREEKRKINPQ